MYNEKLDKLRTEIPSSNRKGPEMMTSLLFVSEIEWACSTCTPSPIIFSRPRRSLRNLCWLPEILTSVLVYIYILVMKIHFLLPLIFTSFFLIPFLLLLLNFMNYFCFQVSETNFLSWWILKAWGDNSSATCA